ncbi:MAG: efflux RND transporter periplasmic adaptor subunit [Magnetospirillum sp.]
MRPFILPSLAALGLVAAIGLSLRDTAPPPAAQPVAQPAAPPFAAYVAGTGLVEAGTRNIAVATPIAGVVEKVAVIVGQQVRVGDELFHLDGRDLMAQLATKRAAVAAAQASVAEAEANLADTRNQLRLAESLGDRRAISQEDLGKRRFAVQADDAKLRAAQAQVVQARAEETEIQVSLDRLVVRSPVDGHVMQVNIRQGEYAPTGQLSSPLVMVGGIDVLAVRVDIDENDAWRYRPGAKAQAFVRGNRDLNFPIIFREIEPYVAPKKSLTGDSTERVDTRVLQVVYQFVNDGKVAVYPGQIVDVYLEVAP